jgi:hypothetical protein
MAGETDKSALEQIAEVLLAIKKHIRRPKDQLSLLQLQAIKKLRDEGE